MYKSDQVCVRCALRVFGHTEWGDYCSEPLDDRYTLMKKLRAAAVSHLGKAMSTYELILILMPVLR